MDAETRTILEVELWKMEENALNICALEDRF